MGDADVVYVFKDRDTPVEPGLIFVPHSLNRIRQAVWNLIDPKMAERAYFNSVIELTLYSIRVFFEGIHDAHDSAAAVHLAFTKDKNPYCLYLRSFSLAGVDRDDETTGLTMMRTTKDLYFRVAVGKALPTGMGRLTFTNLQDVYRPAKGFPESSLDDFDFASFRILEHNWQFVVSEAIKGAKLIVFHVTMRAHGISHELQAIRDCGMTSRTVMVVDEHLGEPPAELRKDFYDIIRLAENSESYGAMHDVKASVAALAGDQFQPSVEVADLSQLPCVVVDRQIQLADSLPGGKRPEDVPYANLLPNSLLNNWNFLIEEFPAMIKNWRAVEADYAAGPVPAAERVATIMYQAMRVFCLAVTLERYYEMSLSIATVGMAYRTITRDRKLMAICYRDAAVYSRWSGDAAAAEWYEKAAQEISQSGS